MFYRSARRGIRAVALAFLTLAVTLAGAGCGKDGGSGLTDPGPSDPGPSDPGPSDPGPGSWPGPAPVGDVIYAVDLANNFLVFGSGSINVLTAKMRITGLPILKRIIGIAIRPSDGALIGVGNDSRVYTIDPLTAQATPLSSGPFSPKISDFFDIHFAMVLEPNGQRVRLIAAESGGNWSINITDGTAVLEEGAHYAAGTALAGQTPRLLGMFYPTLPDSAKQPGWCENLAYAIDADEALMLASCDPATGEWWPTVPSPETSAARGPAGARMSVASSPKDLLEDLKGLIERCGEVLRSSPSGPTVTVGGEPEPQEGEQWEPEPPSILEVWISAYFGDSDQNRLGTVEAVDGGGLAVNWQGEVPSKEPIQGQTWVHPEYVPHPVPPPDPVPQQLRHQVRQEVQLSVAQGQEPDPSTPPAPPSDPRARCS